MRTKFANNSKQYFSNLFVLVHRLQSSYIFRVSLLCNETYHLNCKDVYRTTKFTVLAIKKVVVCFKNFHNALSLLVTVLIILFSIVDLSAVT